MPSVEKRVNQVKRGVVMAKRWRRDELHKRNIKTMEMGYEIINRNATPDVIGLLTFNEVVGWRFEEQTDDGGGFSSFAVLDPMDADVDMMANEDEVIDVWIAVRNFVKRSSLPTVAEDHAAREAEDDSYYRNKEE